MATLAALRGQIDALRSEVEYTVTAGHRDLGPDLWLSCDPAGRAVMSCQSSGAGVVLRLEGGDSGAWAALGMRLPVEALKQARYLGLLVGLHTGDMLSFTPTLRYHTSDGMVDVPTAVPVLMAGGPREHLSYIALDHELLARADGCELNLFFHSDSFVAEFSAIEPLLML
jgi:hypothetical protein